jgi:taurine dioxygenase
LLLNKYLVKFGNAGGSPMSRIAFEEQAAVVSGAASLGAEMARPWTVRRLTQHLGAEIEGLDLAAGLDEAAFAALRGLLLEHHVIFARGQNLAPSQLVETAARFGEIDVNPVSPKVAGMPEVTELVTHDGRSPDIWHFDASFTAAPPMGSLLTMVKSPPVGGDTLWISLHAVYDSLSEAMRAFLAPLSVVYDSALHMQAHIVAEHPLVRAHPETGRTGLFFDPMYAARIPQLNKPESDAVLAFLRSYVADPTFACRFHWSDGAFAMWDNRCTLHRVASDFVGERIIHRVTVAGEPPVRAGGP